MVAALPPRATSSVLATFTEIVIAALSGGVLATIAAAGTLALHPSWISRLVSFAVGALLGAVFLELLPQALETGSAERVMLTVLVGLLGFFLLEKLVLWRHAHGHDAHDDMPTRRNTSTRCMRTAPTRGARDS